MKINTKVMLKVISKKMSIEEISSAIGIPCSRFRKIGEPVSRVSVNSPKYEENIWIYDVQAMGED